MTGDGCRQLEPLAAAVVRRGMSLRHPLPAPWSLPYLALLASGWAFVGACTAPCPSTSRLSASTFDTAQFFVEAVCTEGSGCDFSKSSALEVALSTKKRCFDAPASIRASIQGDTIATYGGSGRHIVRPLDGDQYCTCDSLVAHWESDGSTRTFAAGVSLTLSANTDLTFRTPSNLTPGALHLDSLIPASAAEARFGLHWEPVDAKAPELILELCGISAHRCSVFAHLEVVEQFSGRAVYRIPEDGAGLDPGAYLVRAEWTDVSSSNLVHFRVT